MSASIVDRFSPEYRRTHLGASQWPSVVGVDPYREPIDVYSQFVGLSPPENDDSEAIDLGHALEDGVARYAAKKLGLDAKPCATIEHPDYPWLCATPDRLLSDGTALQVKTTRLTNPSFSHVEEWGEPGTDEVPRRVLVQVTGEMFVTQKQLGIKRTRVAALIGGRGVGIYEVDYDADLAQMLFTRVRDFWRCVEEKRPPPLEATEAFARYLSRRYPTHESGKWLDADETMTRNANALRDAMTQMDALEATVRAARNQLCDSIGDAEGIKGPFGKIAWRGVRGRERLNAERFIEDARAKFGAEHVDELVKRNTERGNGYRAFRPMWTKETA